MRKKKVVWVTGPAGAGKNEACKILRKYGYLVVDADKMGHDILSSKQDLLKKTFGPAALKNGKPDRAFLRSRVFSDRTLLKKLNSMTHPELIKRIRSAIVSSSRRKIAVNAALYKELRAAWPKALVVSVLAPKKDRIKRLVCRKIEPKHVLGIISSQQKDGFYRKIADLTIMNDSSLNELKKALKVISNV
mgnify:CR=1 FL=1